MRARAGNEDGTSGVSGGRVKSCFVGFDSPLGTYVMKR